MANGWRITISIALLFLLVVNSRCAIEKKSHNDESKTAKWREFAETVFKDIRAGRCTYLVQQLVKCQPRTDDREVIKARTVKRTDWSRLKQYFANIGYGRK